ncbi:hypothetical protein BH708_04740 [Brachybacterium sp. P6-10-X1]|uniref:SHOCT domain-containing protein n=1 Tax=Brachybacterium sp. P6-10-X1 TaxID=1903186 RepID=UPI000971B73F|nr:SHOCT domain-containing protein [Brachybacterium sp. P6-10-X1]APX32145.1 hypothetical protein BH708_04740 [Brachybacterium sp. P6-10-X1]
MFIETLTQLTAGGPGGDAAWNGPHVFFPFFPLLLLLLLAAFLITGAVRRRRWWSEGPRRDAESKLGERYAAGEIDEDEFRARRAVLREKK